jgi:hypothetical protein
MEGQTVKTDNRVCIILPRWLLIVLLAIWMIHVLNSCASLIDKFKSVKSAESVVSKGNLNAQ